jgi:hypothetical protein
VSRFVVTAQLREGSGPEVAELLRDGPPFDIEETTLLRHEVFLGENEVVFLFEGPHAEAEARRLMLDARALSRVRHLGAHIEGRPRMPTEVFRWERQTRLEGVAFGAQPGPGDSEGGSVE